MMYTNPHQHELLGIELQLPYNMKYIIQNYKRIPAGQQTLRDMLRESSKLKDLYREKALRTQNYFIFFNYIEDFIFMACLILITCKFTTFHHHKTASTQGG